MIIIDYISIYIIECIHTYAHHRCIDIYIYIGTWTAQHILEHESYIYIYNTPFIHKRPPVSFFYYITYSNLYTIYIDVLDLIGFIDI